MHIHDPQDQPAKVTLEFPSKAACEQALTSLTYWVKFPQFKVQASCHEKNHSGH
jgi:hypothetical protein